MEVTQCRADSCVYICLMVVCSVVSQHPQSKSGILFSMKCFGITYCEFSAFQHCLKAMSLSCLHGHHVLTQLHSQCKRNVLLAFLIRKTIVSDSANYICMMVFVSWRRSQTFLTGFVFFGPFFTSYILTCHRRKSTGVANNINDGSVLFKCSSKFMKVFVSTVAPHLR